MLREQFDGHATVTLTPVGGDPPDRYRVEYRVAGLERRPDGSLVVRRHHQMEVVLPAEYPRQPAACRMLTPIFHPNIDSFTVCTSDFHAAQETLTDLIVRVGQMIAYQKHNVKSPLNAEAAIWCEQNLGRLPVDPTDIYPAEKRAMPAASSSAVASQQLARQPAPPTAPGYPLHPRSPTTSPFAPRPFPVAPTPPPPPIPAIRRPSAETEDVDTFTLQLLSPADWSVTREGVLAKVGQVVRLGPMRFLLAYRLNPPRLQLRNMDGTEVVEITLGATIDVAVGPVHVRVLGADRASIALLGGTSAGGLGTNPRTLAVYWNGVIATEIALAAKTKRFIEGTVRQNSYFDRYLELGRRKLALYEWLQTSTPASVAWKAALTVVDEALKEAIRLQMGTGANGR